MSETVASAVDRLRAANPVPRPYDDVDARGHRDLARITDGSGNVRPAANRGHRLATWRRVTSATVAIAVATFAVLVVGLTERGGRPALATPATPDVIAFAHGAHGPAADALRAAAAQLRAKEAGSSGDVLHSVTQLWSLSTDVSDKRARTSLIARERELWLTPSGSGRYDDAKVVVSVLVGEALASETEVPESHQFGPGGYADDNRGLPTSAPALRAALAPRIARMGLPQDQAIAVYLMSNLDQATGAPFQLAAFYDVLAQVGDVFDAGMVKDRAGRPGHAVGVVSSDATSPTTGTEYLILDEQTGAPLERDTVYSPDPPRGLHLRPGPLTASYHLFQTLSHVRHVGDK
jgi:hypothetical protein